MSHTPSHRDRLFRGSLVTFSLLYLALLVALLLGNVSYTSPSHLWEALKTREILASIRLSLLSSTLSALLSMLVALPLGYYLARTRTKWKILISTIVDIPILLPPLVIGISLLIFFQTSAGKFLESGFQSLFGRGFTYDIPGVILAQFTVAAAFTIRTMEVSFSRVDPRIEHMASSLGCSWSRTFFSVVLPQVKGGMLTAFTLGWARALGEFGPLLVFAGATRMKTEVLPTTIFLELSVGNIEAAVAVSFIMIFVAVTSLLLLRHFNREPLP